jgi:hypothetical protein
LGVWYDVSQGYCNHRFCILITRNRRWFLLLFGNFRLPFWRGWGWGLVHFILFGLFYCGYLLFVLYFCDCLYMYILFYTLFIFSCLTVLFNLHVFMFAKCILVCVLVFSFEGVFRFACFTPKFSIVLYRKIQETSIGNSMKSKYQFGLINTSLQ